MNEIVVKSPAKINIGLNVINKRPDGFHNLETIFYPLNLYDEIRITKSNHFSFNSSDRNLNSDKTNVIIKAKEELEKYFKLIQPIRDLFKKEYPYWSGTGRW